MTSLPFFIAASAGLTLVTLLILCYPLLKKSVAEPMAERQQTTLNIFRDQLHELERDRDNGLLCAADFEQAAVYRDRIRMRQAAIATATAYALCNHCRSHVARRFNLPSNSIA